MSASGNQFSLTRAASINRRCGEKQNPLSNTLVRFRCSETIIPEFGQAVFKYSLDTRGFIQIAKQTTSVAHLGADRFAKMPFACPTVDKQKRIASSLQIQLEQIQVEKQNLTKRQQLKSGLRNDLLTGRVRVPAKNGGSA
jgi:type I restriction enzyme S subunit